MKDAAIDTKIFTVVGSTVTLTMFLLIISVILDHR